MECQVTEGDCYQISGERVFTDTEAFEQGAKGSKGISHMVTEERAFQAGRKASGKALSQSIAGVRGGVRRPMQQENNDTADVQHQRESEGLTGGQMLQNFLNLVRMQGFIHSETEIHFQ